MKSLTLVIAFVLGAILTGAATGAVSSYLAGKAESEQHDTSVVLIHISAKDPEAVSFEYWAKDRSLLADEGDIILVMSGDVSILRSKKVSGYTTSISKIRLIAGDAARIQKGDVVSMRVGNLIESGITTL